MSYLRRASRKAKSKKGKKRNLFVPNPIGLGLVPDSNLRVKEDRKKESEQIHQPTKSKEDEIREEIFSYFRTIGSKGPPLTRRNEELHKQREHFKAIDKSRKTKLPEEVFGYSGTIEGTNILDTPLNRSRMEQREKLQKKEKARKQRMKDEVMASGKEMWLSKQGDRNEIEAEEMAEKVIGGRVVQQNQTGTSSPLVGRMEDEQVAKAEDEQVSKAEDEQVSKAEEETVATKGLGTRQGPRKKTGKGFGQQLDTKAGTGSPLPAPLRAFMERKMGADFAGVRVHTDSQSIQMSKDISAQAFTYKRDIYFNAGKYNPESHEGKKLLAHELTHVMQQDSGAREKKLDRKVEGGGGEKKKEGPTPGVYYVNSPVEGRKTLEMIAQAQSPEEVFSILSQKYNAFSGMQMPDAVDISGLPKDFIRKKFGENVIQQDCENPDGSYQIYFKLLKVPEKYTGAEDMEVLVFKGWDSNQDFQQNIKTVRDKIQRFQEAGNPLVHKSSNDWDRIGVKGRETGNSIDLGWLFELFGFYKPSPTGFEPRTPMERSGDNLGKEGILFDSYYSEEGKSMDNAELEAQFLVNKEHNTWVTWKRLEKNERFTGWTNEQTGDLTYFLKVVDANVGSQFDINSVKAVNPSNESFSLAEVVEILKSKGQK